MKISNRDRGFTTFCNIACGDVFIVMMTTLASFI